MIRSPELPGRYYLDGRRFNYYQPDPVAVWIDRQETDGSFRCQPLRDGEPVGVPVWVSGRVLNRNGKDNL